MAMEGERNSSSWTWEENKAFEMALEPSYFESEISNEQWEKIAAQVPGKTLNDVKKHFEMLVEDINNIDLGLVDLPDYRRPSKGCTDRAVDKYNNVFISAGNVSPAPKELERRRAIAWTEDEHRLFLHGLDKYGRGDWRSISRNLIQTRTPTQVASHAQKYFKRLKNNNTENRRSSIHDITTVEEEISTETPVKTQ